MTTPPELAMVNVMGYPGGKNGSGVYQSIINQMPVHDVYIEPFLGGGAVMRLKRPAEINIGLDLEPGVITTFNDAYRRPPPEMKVPAGTTGGGVVRSATVKTGGRITPSRSAIQAFTIAPGGVSGSLTINGGVTGDRATSGGAAAYRFHNTDALEFLENYEFRGSELVYCDPPYVHSTRGRKDLYNFEMSDAQHVQLLCLLKTLPCRVMLSGYHSDLYLKHLDIDPWRVVTFQTTNRAGQLTTEWLWMNYPEPLMLHDYQYLGKDYRERERIKKKKTRWVTRLRNMPMLERQALMGAISELG